MIPGLRVEAGRVPGVQLAVDQLRRLGQLSGGLHVDGGLALVAALLVVLAANQVRDLGLSAGRQGRAGSAEIAVDVVLDGLRTSAEEQALVVVEREGDDDSLQLFDLDLLLEDPIAVGHHHRVRPLPDVEQHRVLPQVAERLGASAQGDGHLDGSALVFGPLEAHLECRLAATEVEDHLLDRAALDLDLLLLDVVSDHLLARQILEKPVDPHVVAPNRQHPEAGLPPDHVAGVAGQGANLPLEDLLLPAPALGRLLLSDLLGLGGELDAEESLGALRRLVLQLDDHRAPAPNHRQREQHQNQAVGSQRLPVPAREPRRVGQPLRVAEDEDAARGATAEEAHLDDRDRSGARTRVLRQPGEEGRIHPQHVVHQCDLLRVGGEGAEIRDDALQAFRDGRCIGELVAPHDAPDQQGLDGPVIGNARQQPVLEPLLPVELLDQAHQDHRTDGRPGSGGSDGEAGDQALEARLGLVASSRLRPGDRIRRPHRRALEAKGGCECPLLFGSLCVPLGLVELSHGRPQQRLLGLDGDRLLERSLGLVEATLGCVNLRGHSQQDHPIRGRDGVGFQRLEGGLRVPGLAMGPSQAVSGAGVGGCQRDGFLQVRDGLQRAARLHQDGAHALERRSVVGAQGQCGEQRPLGAGVVPEMVARPTETGERHDVPGIERGGILVGEQGLGAVPDALVQLGHLAMGRGGKVGIELPCLLVGSPGEIRLEPLGAEVPGPDQQPGPLLLRHRGQPAQLLVGPGILRCQLDDGAEGRHRLVVAAGGGEEFGAPQLGIAVAGIQADRLAVELQGALGFRPGQCRVRTGDQHDGVAAAEERLPHLQPVAILGSAKTGKARALRRWHLARGESRPLDLPPEGVAGTARGPLQLPPGPHQLQGLHRLESPPVGAEIRQARRHLRRNGSG